MLTIGGCEADTLAAPAVPPPDSLEVGRLAAIDDIEDMTPPPNWATPVLLPPIVATAETPSLLQVRAALEQERKQAYLASPFAGLSTQFLSRFSRDPQAVPGTNEFALDATWRIRLPADASPLCRTLAKDLQAFLSGPMELAVKIETAAPATPAGELPAPNALTLILAEAGGGEAHVAGSFTLDCAPTRVQVIGADRAGLRDGVVQLVTRMGLRQAPILTTERQTYRPRLALRLGAIPLYGSVRELVFQGHNAVLVGNCPLTALADADNLPDLATAPPTIFWSALRDRIAQARTYAVRTYLQISVDSLPADHAVFEHHAAMRGARMATAKNQCALCSEAPETVDFYHRSMHRLFRELPDLDGIVMIVGGEGFTHCFTRARDSQPGHTNCPRCEKLGAEQVVSDLCNRLAASARQLQPQAEVVVWPYSAATVWSQDADQAALIARLKPGTALVTEVEKDEVVEKPGGIRKRLWDYSIDLAGLGVRARQQVAACARAGIPCYLKNEPERSYEAAALPQIPCLDRWMTRAQAIADSGAAGVFDFPAFGPNYGTSPAELNALVGWTPGLTSEAALTALAGRIAGDPAAAAHLRKAWRLVSAAIAEIPALPPYYRGPGYLGPAQPMCVDRQAPLPEIFYGRMFFAGGGVAAEALALRPIFLTAPPASERQPAYLLAYRRAEERLRQAGGEIDQARRLVPPRCQMVFNAEAGPTVWLYHTVRSAANFSESCALRDRLAGGAPDAPGRAADLARWRTVLVDERINTTAALPVAEADCRLDFRFGGDHSFAHTTELLRAKLALLQKELEQLPPAAPAR